MQHTILGYEQQENRAHSLSPHVDPACAGAFYSLCPTCSSTHLLPHHRCEIEPQRVSSPKVEEPESRDEKLTGR